MILPLIYYGNPYLRIKSQEVGEITLDIKQLCYDMVETMDANNGIGLAAIQVAKPLRILVIRSLLEKDSNNTTLQDAEIFINPKLSNPSEKTVIASEGCLSIPGIHQEVERPEAICIEAMDLEGKTVSKKFTGFAARQIMHENDHLNGVLFIDRLLAKKRKDIELELRKIKAKYN